MFFDCAYGNVLFFGEFTYAGKCFAKDICYKTDRVVIFIFLFGRSELARFRFELCKLQTSLF